MDNEAYQYCTVSDGSNLVVSDLGLPMDFAAGGNVFYIINQDDVNSLPLQTQNTELYPNVNSLDYKLVTLDDGRMFLTTSKEETLESIEPHLLTSPETELTEEIEPAEIDEPLLDENAQYKIVEFSNGTQALLKVIIKPDDEAIEEDEETDKKPEKRFPCAYEGCDKVYSTAYLLRLHIRGFHTDTKPFECTAEGCGKRFSTNYSLKSHNRTHTGEKPYVCVLCEKRFKTRGDCQKHLRTHTGEKPFLCPIDGCGKAFTTSNIRKVHIRSHTGERPFTCTYPNCGKAFTSSTNYKNHVRIHSGERPYLCPVEGCGKRFTEYSSLYKHNSVHQPARAFNCNFCEQKFKQESALTQHKQRVHKVVVTKDGTEIYF